MTNRAGTSPARTLYEASYRPYRIRAGLAPALIHLFLPFGGASQLADTAVEIGVLSLFGGFAAFFAHFREMFWAVFGHVGRAAFSGDRAVVFTAALLLEPGAAFLADNPIVIFTVLVANRASPLTARL